MLSVPHVLAYAALLAVGVLARVTNITVTDSIRAGENLTAVLEVTNYIQNWADFGVSISDSFPT